MVHMSLYTNNMTMADMLTFISKDVVAFIGKHRLEVYTELLKENQDSSDEKDVFIDVAIIDITSENGITAAKNIRQQQPFAEIILITEQSKKVEEYLIPEIKASMVMMCPLHEEEVYDRLLHFFQYYFEKYADPDFTSKREEGVFVIHKKEERIRIPMESIYYLEAKEKKVFVRTKTKEYISQDTLETLSHSMPEQFVRCHRSFIVNMKLVYKVDLSRNKIYLEDHTQIPLSRSYKSKMRVCMDAYLL